MWPQLTCDGKVKVDQKKFKALGKNAESLGCPGDECALFPCFLGSEVLLSVPVGTEEVKPWDVFCFWFSFMILFSNVKEHLGSVVGGGRKQSGAGRPRGRGSSPS